MKKIVSLIVAAMIVLPAVASAQNTDTQVKDTMEIVGAQRSKRIRDKERKEVPPVVIEKSDCPNADTDEVIKPMKSDPKGTGTVKKAKKVKKAAKKATKKSKKH